MKIAVIGGGISGLSIAKMLKKENNDVVVYESDSRPGGLIKCDVVEGNLYHRIGGHVFNSKREDVLNWFWGQFDKEKEFIKAKRNATVSISEGLNVPYPIENNIHYFSENVQKSFVTDLVNIAKSNNQPPTNFAEFLVQRFGKTLYDLYFKPYNYKVWRKELDKVPLSWLEGKLPMPSVEEMIYFNMNRVSEEEFVHSSFYYPINGGSQFIANRLAEGLEVNYNHHLRSISKIQGNWIIDNVKYDKVIFCGNIKQLPSLFDDSIYISNYSNSIDLLESHGTTTVLCEIEKNPYSWIYMPSSSHDSHRIICTGNFSVLNNSNPNILTGTVEFTDYMSLEDIMINLSLLPYSPKYISHHYEKFTYPIQDLSTRQFIGELKESLEKESFFLLGRFAEWEYYNMDVAVGAAIDLSNRLN